MSKVLRVLLFVYILLFFTMSLTYAAPAKITYTTYEDPVNMFKVSYPSNWQLDRRPATLRDFTMVATFMTSTPLDIRNGLLVGIGVIDPKSLPMPPDVFGKSIVELDPTQKEGFLDIVRSYISGNAPNSKNLSLTKTKYGEHHAMDIVGAANIHSRDATLRLVILFSKDYRFYIAAFACDSTTYDTYKPTMDKMLKSLHFFESNIPYKGTYTYSDGYRYEGEYLNGKENGKGESYWTDGTQYKGDFVNSKRTGKGVYTWSDGNRYEGDFIDNKRTGKGVYTWSNGHRYEGDFIDGVRTGKGIYYWPNGDRYDGEYVNNKRSGYGVYTKADGTRYEGKFVDDKFIKE